MTLRDYFAAHALVLTEYACDTVGEPEGLVTKCNPVEHAKAAYGIADAMLAERAK
jgi:hypothetical protein